MILGLDKIEMERAHTQIEKQLLHLQEKHKNMKHDLDITKKSRDQKDKHIALLYRENEKLKKVQEKEEGKSTIKSDDKENKATNILTLGYKRPTDSENAQNDSPSRSSECSESIISTKDLKKSVLKGVQGLAGMNYQTEKHYKLQINKLKKQVKELESQLTKTKNR